MQKMPSPLRFIEPMECFSRTFPNAGARQRTAWTARGLDSGASELIANASLQFPHPESSKEQPAGPLQPAHRNE
jgi:hypothetical protein